MKKGISGHSKLWKTDLYRSMFSGRYALIKYSLKMIFFLNLVLSYFAAKSMLICLVLFLPNCVNILLITSKEMKVAPFFIRNKTKFYPLNSIMLAMRTNESCGYIYIWKKTIDSGRAWKKSISCIWVGKK